jgi:quercetin dioxygenase-like cupin family protein
MPQHHAEGPITIQGLRGALRVTVEGDTYDVGIGDLLSIGVDVPHAVESDDGATFLLTVAFDGPHGSQAEQRLRD